MKIESNRTFLILFFTLYSFRTNKRFISETQLVPTMIYYNKELGHLYPDILIKEDISDTALELLRKDLEELKGQRFIHYHKGEVIIVDVPKRRDIDWFKKWVPKEYFNGVKTFTKNFIEGASNEDSYQVSNG